MEELTGTAVRGTLWSEHLNVFKLSTALPLPLEAAESNTKL